MLSEQKLCGDFLCDWLLFTPVQRTHRHELFTPSAIGTCPDESRSKFQLKAVDSLLGNSAKVGGVIVLGMLTQLKEGKFFLEDPTGVVQLDLSKAISFICAVVLFINVMLPLNCWHQFHSGLYTESCFVLTEGTANFYFLGWYEDEVFHVDAFGFPPTEPSAITRAYYGNTNFFGGPSSTSVKTSAKLKQLEEENEGAMFVFLSDVWLDQAEVLDKLRIMFSGSSIDGWMAVNACSLKALADMICEYPSIHKSSRFVFVPGSEDPGPGAILPRPPLTENITEEFRQQVPFSFFTTNPCSHTVVLVPSRVQYCTQEIIIFREDLVNKMCRNCVRFPSSNLDIPNHFVKTILSQGHLTPLPLNVSPVYWAYDYSLRTYPLPDLIVFADKYDPFTVTNTDCLCINPRGSSSAAGGGPHPAHARKAAGFVSTATPRRHLARLRDDRSGANGRAARPPLPPRPAMARRSGLEELQLSADEAARLAEAFRDPQFRSLFAEYAAELADPARRAVYEAEVAALERERGVEARFLHPTPGWVLRTSQAGRRRCYVNVCSHPLVGRPQARREPGGRGCTWRLPHCLAPGREEPRRPPEPHRLLYDVLFHPDALRLAARSARFRRLLEDTALEALETHFQAGLDRANAVPLRGVRYKGAPQATLLRTPLPGAPPWEQQQQQQDDEDAAQGASPLPPFPTPYAYPPPAPEETRPAPPAAEAAAAAPTTPRWSLRQRSYVDLQDYRCSRDSAPSPVPRELVLTVELPLLSAAAQAQLEVRGQELQLDSQRPAAAYRLRVPLPYPVDEARGRATFNKATRQLLVTLPVVAPEPPQQQAPPPDHAELPAQPQDAAARDRPGPPPPKPHVRPAPPSGASPGLPSAADCRASPPAGACSGVHRAGRPEDLAASGSVGHGAEPPPQPGTSSPGTASIPAAQPRLADPGGPATSPSCRGSSAEQIPELAAGSGRSPSCAGGGSREERAARPSSPAAPALPPEGGPAMPPLPAAGPTPPRCPPFCCTQDEESLTLLLRVPDIVPQSLQGEVGADHYRVGFASRDSASYALLLQFLPEDKLTPPETEISVSLHNAVIGLAKAPESARLWTKFCFGLNGEDLKAPQSFGTVKIGFPVRKTALQRPDWQERWLLTEDNVDGFLGSLAAASCPDRSTVELQPLVEVLAVSEGRSQIRLKGEEQQSPDPGEADGIVGPAKADCDPESGRELPAEADSHLPPATGASGSLGAGETMGRAGWESGHCSELNPGGPDLLLPGKWPTSPLSHESERACTASQGATSTTQAQLSAGEPAEGGEGRPQPAGGRGGSERRPAPPVLRETDLRDGSMQLVSQHTTHCAVTLQNPLLYELD
ncbi:hypothetical protein lerEdw1_007526 [Lerista edwardsae]|nr:hypothetical protein lerEdw1_007526 [Lerista edwardsae]